MAETEGLITDPITGVTADETGKRCGDEIFRKGIFFLSMRAAEENVAGNAKLTEINRKHLANRGNFFRLICTTDQAANFHF
jgi:hypothetical protein